MRLAVIPARGGSKRIPRKNVRAFAGRPMIAHSIERAIESRLFDRVIVSTDDGEVADVARSYGAEIPFMRPTELSDDYTGTTEVISHAVRWAGDQGLGPEFVCCIYATAPFIELDDLQRAFDVIKSSSWQYVFPATAFEFPVFRAFRPDDKGGVTMIFPEHFRTRSQDLPEVLHDVGQFYWGRASAWLNCAKIYDQHSTIIQIPRWRVQDIDTLDDWRRAEMLWRMLRPTEASLAGT